MSLAGYVATILLSTASAGEWRAGAFEVSAARSSEFSQLESIARRYLGRPYRMGGVGSPAFDCSGFTCRVFAEAGYAIPRVSREQARSGIAVSLDAIAAGDLLFFAEPGRQRISHVGMYIGGGRMIHASSTQGRVVVADLDRRYYRNRLRAARRVLGQSAPAIDPIEWTEHEGGDTIPVFLRMPNRVPEPTGSLRLIAGGRTTVGLRSLVGTEHQRFGFTLAPELSFVVESWAFEVAVAVPIRFEEGEDPTVGRMERVADGLRFLRQLSLGLPGAELELRFDRLGTYSVGPAIDRFTPSVAASGVPALSVGATPLSFFGAYRGPRFQATALLDDVVDPSLMGAELGFVAGGWFSLSVSYATDQRGGLPTKRRAFDVGAASAGFRIYDGRTLSLEAALEFAVQHALQRTGFGGAVELGLQYRPSTDLVFSMEFRSAYLGADHLDQLFGASYLAGAPHYLEGLSRHNRRFSFGGALLAGVRNFSFGVGFWDAIDGVDLDRRLYAVLEVKDLELARWATIELAAQYAGRARPSGSSAGHEVIQASLGVRFLSWLWLEAYFRRAGQTDAGVGLMVAYQP